MEELNVSFTFFCCCSKEDVRPTAAELLKDDPFVQFSSEEMKEVF